MDKARPESQPRVRLTDARNARRWSQQEVADQLGTTHVNVSRWERGITRPSPYFRKKLSVLFGKSEPELDLASEGEVLPVNSGAAASRSEEHTSELQSPDHLVCRLLLEKKKKKYRVRSRVRLSDLAQT